MKTKITKSFLLSILLLSLIFSGCSKNKTKNLNIGIYGVENSFVCEGLKKSLEELCIQENLKATFFEYDIESPLKEQIGKTKIDLLLSSAGYAASEALKASEYDIPAELTSNMTTSIRQSALGKDNKLYALPLLNDFFKMEINTGLLKKSDDLQINDWDAFLAVSKNLAKEKNNPITFAGKNSREVLDFYGALCEALNGIDSYNEAVMLMNENATLPMEGLASLLCDSSNSPLATAVAYLKNWNKHNLINKNSFSEFTTNDINTLAERNLNGLVFQNLSSFRQCNQMKSFDQFFLPSRSKRAERHFTANIIYALKFSKNSKVNTILENLVSGGSQSNLSRNTGLAPVLANAKTPDIQASDARFYVAATSYPLAGLGHESALNAAQLKELADIIKGKIIY